jgi:hypothetical protein
MVAVRPDLALVALADGAEKHWRYVDRPVSDTATKVVDHGHPSQPLKTGLAAYYGDKRVAALLGIEYGSPSRSAVSTWPGCGHARRLVQALERAEQAPADFLNRHIRGD